MANYISQYTGVQIDNGIANANSAVQPSDLTTALADKQDNLVSGTNIKSLNSTTLLGTGNVDINKTTLGLSNVDNTADLAKPISNATQTALNGKAASVHTHITGDVTGLDTALSGKAASVHNHVTSDVTGLDTALNGKQPALGFTPENTNNKGQANGYASLGGDGKVPSNQLPSYVDDVLEYANLATFPVTGISGVIYVALDTNKAYRWGGSSYIYITSGAVDSVAGKTGVVTIDKTDVGLANVDNTSDANKPISSATQTALDNKASTTHTHSGATTSANGFMSSTDKSKLDGIATNANNYSHPANHPPSIITQDASNRFVTDAEKATWNAKLAATETRAIATTVSTASGNAVTVIQNGNGTALALSTTALPVPTGATNNTGMIGGLHLYNSGATPVEGALAAGISFGRVGTGRRGALIAASQDTADGDQIGLKFYTRNLTVTGNDDLNTTPALHLKPDNTVAIASSTETPALTVTQTGTGPAFVVEDATSPDVTPFSIDADGTVRIAGGETQGGGTRISSYDYTVRVAPGGGGLSMNIFTDAPTDPANVRMFRSTNTTGNVSFGVLLGNGTTSSNHTLAANNGQVTRISSNNGSVELGNGGNTVMTVGGLVINKVAVVAPAASDGNVFSGSYTPTVAGVLNLASSTAHVLQYARVGNYIQVSGAINIGATAVGRVILTLTLPVPSNFTGSSNMLASGTVSSQITESPMRDGGIIYDDGNGVGKVQLLVYCGDTTNRTYRVMFAYKVVT